MTRSRESADQTVATQSTPVHSAGAGTKDCETHAKCAWGTPERSGEKPVWYRGLFH